jgi:hypothetical protein
MYMINGPGDVRENSKRVHECIDTIAAATNSGIFASDCLVTWAKSMGFLEDKKFVDCVSRRLNGVPQHDVPVMGIVWRTHVMCWAAQQCVHIDGDFVEAGCYYGDTARIVYDYVDFATLDKTYWLYDLFDENDGSVAEVLTGHSGGLLAKATANFSQAPNARIIAGRIPDSFGKGAPERIALMHIDMNNAASERATLEALYDRVQPGGIIIFDDYGWIQYLPQKESADEFMAKRGRKILELPTGQGMAIR